MSSSNSSNFKCSILHRKSLNSFNKEISPNLVLVSCILTSVNTLHLMRISNIKYSLTIPIPWCPNIFLPLCIILLSKNCPKRSTSKNRIIMMINWNHNTDKKSNKKDNTIIIMNNTHNKSIKTHINNMLN